MNPPPVPPSSSSGQHPRPRGWHPSITIITGLVMLGIGMVVGYFYGFGKMMMEVERNMRELLVPPAAEMQVTAVARKFEWHFHYPGADGEYGRTSLREISVTNPVGLDFKDASAQDDLITRELVLPCETEVLVATGSVDVIHALGNLHGDFALDATPGVNNEAVLYTPSSPTSGTLRCVQLCGAGFKDHHAPYKFVTDEDFEKWLKEQPTAAETAAKPASELPGK